MLNYEVFYAEDGFINKLQPADQENATNLLIKKAQEDAQNSNLTKQAEDIFYQRVEDLGGEKPLTLP